MVTTLFGGNENYRRLSRSRTTLLGSWSLWEGSDHFVQMEVLGFHESHQRFYFEDIRAFTVRATNRGFWMHLILGGLTVTAAGLGVWLSSFDYFAAVYWMLLAVTVSSALAWLVHFVLGPTCVCHVVTPVQNARLRALGRVRSARKILFHLTYRAELTQGGPISGDRQPETERPVPLVTPQPALKVAAEAEPSTLLGTVVTGFLFLNAAFLCAFLVWDSYTLRVVQLILTVVLSGLGITCAARSRAAGKLFRRIGWVLFGVNGFVFLLWYGYSVYLTTVSKTRRAGMEVNLALDMLRTSPHTSTFWFWVVLVNACFSVVAGCVGLAALIREGRRRT